MNNENFNNQDFRGYKQAVIPKIDESLAHTNSTTACGEYLRRYWHPVALTSEVSETPKSIRILGEDLVIFKTTKGNIGLVHKACPHRRASMVYGKLKKEVLGAVIMVGCFLLMVRFLKHLVKIPIQYQQKN
jgi:nitrite reductase/ring-hydroxylating ferredoxin subunit